jgi:hypothetical protein
MLIEDEKILISLLLREHKNMNMAGCSQLKFTFYFMERTHKTLQLVMKFYMLKDHGCTHKFYLNHFLQKELLNIAVFQNYEVTLGQMLNYFE